MRPAGRQGARASGFALMVDVLEAISSICLRNKEKHPGR